jgi:hypothetical protein
MHVSVVTVERINIELVSLVNIVSLKHISSVINVGNNILFEFLNLPFSKGVPFRGRDY